jgi:GNAT superfamily N-acetyltransferase
MWPRVLVSAGPILSMAGQATEESVTALMSQAVWQSAGAAELIGGAVGSLRIRRAESGDECALAGLNQYVQDLHARAESTVFKLTDLAAAEEMFRGVLAAEATVVLLAEAGGQGVGYLMADEVVGDETAFVRARRSLFIRHLAVTEDARQQGVAQALMAEAEQVARDRGLDTMTLDHWAFNETAARFFERQGFEIFNVRRRRLL